MVHMDDPFQQPRAVHDGLFRVENAVTTIRQLHAGASRGRKIDLLYHKLL